MHFHFQQAGVKKQGILFAVLALSLCLFAVQAQGQSTRAGEIAAKQAEKAKKLAPYAPNKAERIILRVEGWGLLAPPLGLYPFLGSAYSGGGLAVGPGYRRLFGDNAIFDVHGAWSISNYKLANTSILFPALAHGKISMNFDAKYIDANKVAFYGIGNDTSKEDLASFTYKPLTVGMTEAFHATRWLYAGGGIDYMKIDTEEGARSPSIDETFAPAETPGFKANPDWVVGHLFGGVDWRQSPGYTTSGGLYGLDYYFYNQRSSSNFDFHRIDVDLRQFIPILRANQVIALRATAAFTDVVDESQVPFYLLPRLGGGEELRGFPDFRFRDRNRLLLTAEYRWTPSKFLDMAIFYEAGKVAARSQDLDLNDLHKSYGIGVRFHTPIAVPLRIELAHSVEGTRLIISGGTAF